MFFLQLDQLGNAGTIHKGTNVGLTQTTQRLLYFVVEAAQNKQRHKLPPIFHKHGATL